MSTSIFFTTRDDATIGTEHQVGLPALFRQVLRLLRERRDTSRARAQLRWELHQYSDRALSDMGLARSDIEDVVHGRYAA